MGMIPGINQSDLRAISRREEKTEIRLEKALAKIEELKNKLRKLKEVKKC